MTFFGKNREKSSCKTFHRNTYYYLISSICLQPFVQDCTFNLYTGKYQPYKKPNDTPTYISDNSNHPPNNISKRISNISSDKATINNAAPFYNAVLSVSEYKKKLYLSTRFDAFKESKTKKDNMI